ncbi:hypothetical protein, partial [Limosilactobacillus fermentum]|uniref:hypothetical protein n=1 Tax=Limosilactobacillus fermentum TaxID=1613 RepID=UPI001C9E487E
SFSPLQSACLLLWVDPSPKKAIYLFVRSKYSRLFPFMQPFAQNLHKKMEVRPNLLDGPLG